jgi:hypothetical protein
MWDKFLQLLINGITISKKQNQKRHKEKILHQFRQSHSSFFHFQGGETAIFPKISSLKIQEKQNY